MKFQKVAKLTNLLCEDTFLGGTEGKKSKEMTMTKHGIVISFQMGRQYSQEKTHRKL